MNGGPAVSTTEKFMKLQMHVDAFYSPFNAIYYYLRAYMLRHLVPAALVGGE